MTRNALALYGYLQFSTYVSTAEQRYAWLRADYNGTNYTGDMALLPG